MSNVLLSDGSELFGITLDDMKEYLRVDSSDEDSTILFLGSAAEQLCIDTARLSEDELTELSKVEVDDNGNVTEVPGSLFSKAEVIQIRGLMRGAILYSLAYFYENREEGDHSKLARSLRGILSAVRERRMY